VITKGDDLNTGIFFPAADTIAFAEGGSEAARIDSSGRLLVGSSSGSGNARLQIQGGTVFGDAYLDLCFNGTIVSGQTLGELRFTDAASSANVYAKIAVQADAAPGSNDYPGRLVFSTTADGAASSTERLRITSAGVLQVADAGNIAVGTGAGTKIGTATTQKLGFYNATPVVQPAAVADATDAVDVITQLNDLLAKLRTLGIIAT
jgi:hypothetical protein